MPELSAITVTVVMPSITMVTVAPASAVPVSVGVVLKEGETMGVIVGALGSEVSMIVVSTLVGALAPAALLRVAV